VVVQDAGDASDHLPVLATFAAALAWAGAGAGLAWWRYQRLQVTR